MRELTEFQKVQIVGANMAEASVTKAAELLGFSRATILRTMTEFKNQGKPSSKRSNSCQTYTNLPTEIDVH